VTGSAPSPPRKLNFDRPLASIAMMAGAARPVLRTFIAYARAPPGYRSTSRGRRAPDRHIQLFEWLPAVGRISPVHLGSGRRRPPGLAASFRNAGISLVAFANKHNTVPKRIKCRHDHASSITIQTGSHSRNVCAIKSRPSNPTYPTSILADPPATAPGVSAQTDTAAHRGLCATIQNRLRRTGWRPSVVRTPLRSRSTSYFGETARIVSAKASHFRPNEAVAGPAGPPAPAR